MEVVKKKPKAHKELSGITVLDSSDEFAPKVFKVRAFNLGEFGIHQIPSIAQTSHHKKDIPSIWHVHKRCIEFIYCVSGTCEYESEGRRFSLTPGMMFLSRPHESHRQLVMPKGYSTFVMMFRPSGNKTIQWFADEFAKLPRLFSCSQSVAVRFGRIFALAERGDKSLGACLRMNMLVQSLLFEILDSASLSITRKIPAVFGEIAERMRKHPERDYPLDGLVAESGVSKALFMALFKKANGLAPHSYLVYCRIEESKKLLRKGLAVKIVADRFGFTTSSHFSRTFRNFVGTTPKMWLAAEKS